MTPARFGSPEDAALSEWRQTPSAGARVKQVTVCGQRAEVVIELQPGYREWVYCVRGPEGWRTTVSGNGPTPSWEDPDTYGSEP